MVTKREFADYIVDQIDPSCEVSHRMMFGEYALYSKGKVVALLCDGQLFVKDTKPGRAFIGKVVEAPPYPGAKAALLIQDQVEDREWLTELIRLTERALPRPRPKTKRRGKR